MSAVGRFLLAALLIVPGSACGQDEVTPTIDDGRVREKLVIFSSAAGAGATPQEFMVELALTPEEQTRGLMFREIMGERQGMLFVFQGVSMHSFWMKNTLIPLDIIFIRADGGIAHIAERTVPQSLGLIPSRVPVRSVLELNGGTAERLGLKVGDKVSHPLIDTE